MTVDLDELERLHAELRYIFPALVAEIRALRELNAALCQCESTRGRYSCSPQHDSRCAKDRGIGPECNCGADRLDAAVFAVDGALRRGERGTS